MSDEQQYLDLLNNVLQNGITKSNRTNIKTKSIFGNLMRFNLMRDDKKIIPLLTTKDMRKTSEMIFKELEFFISGKTDSTILSQQGVHIWDQNTSRENLDKLGFKNRDVGDMGPCFTENTLVLTDYGYTPIKYINTDMRVFTALGNWKKVLNVMKSLYTKNKIFILSIHGYCRNIQCTPEHPFLCLNIETNNIEWVQANNLNYRIHLMGLKINNKSILPIFKNDDVLISIEYSDFWFLLGYYMNSSPRFKQAILSLYSPAYQNIFHMLDDYIPEWVIDSPKFYLMEFYKGYIDRDGTMVVPNLNMAFAFQRIMAKLGYITEIISYYDSYAINLQTRSKCKLDPDNYIWFEIANIHSKSQNGTFVYNLEVEDDASYTVNHVHCHNCYGFQWRHFQAPYENCLSDYTNKGIDQLQNTIDDIKRDPFSRRHIITAWNPTQLSEMVLPPCHMMFHFNVLSDSSDKSDVSDGLDKPKYLDCLLYQRSADLPLGVPFNIASYATLTHIVANLTNLTAHELIYITGDNHIYENQIENVKQQINRKPFPFPEFEFEFESNDKIPQTIDEYKASHFKIKNYQCHPYIKYPFTV